MLNPSISALLKKLTWQINSEFKFTNEDGLHGKSHSGAEGRVILNQLSIASTGLSRSDTVISRTRIISARTHCNNTPYRYAAWGSWFPARATLFVRNTFEAGRSRRFTSTIVLGNLWIRT